MQWNTQLSAGSILYFHLREKSLPKSTTKGAQKEGRFFKCTIIIKILNVRPFHSAHREIHPNTPNRIRNSNLHKAKKINRSW